MEAADHGHDAARMVAYADGDVAGADEFADRRIVARPAVLGQIDLRPCVRWMSSARSSKIALVLPGAGARPLRANQSRSWIF